MFSFLHISDQYFIWKRDQLGQIQFKRRSIQMGIWKNTYYEKFPAIMLSKDSGRFKPYQISFSDDQIFYCMQPGFGIWRTNQFNKEFHCSSHKFIYMYWRQDHVISRTSTRQAGSGLEDPKTKYANNIL
ncbi:hypothetical protein AMTRI_Chr13g86530 [Amborella trichopoda]